MQRPDDIINITDLISDIVVDMAYATDDNFTGKVVPGYTENVAFLTTAATQKLKNVQDEARQFGLCLKIFDSYRPRRSVLYFQNEWRYQTDEDPKIKQRFYPELSKEDLFSIGYIATRSSHSRASTVDLTLIDIETKEELDMGTEFDFFGEQSHTANPNISKQQQRNRLLLKSLMEKQTFINYNNEWWHFRLANEPYDDCLDFEVKL
jgi:D-alanyl-D-alanine dipeptidase